MQCINTGNGSNQFNCDQAPDKSVTENYCSYFSTKTYVVGTEKKRLDDTVLLSTQNTCFLMGKKIIAVLR